MEHRVEIRQEMYRLYAVLIVDGSEYRERIGLELRTMSPQRAEAILGKVTERLLKKAQMGQRLRRFKTIDKPAAAENSKPLTTE